MRIKRLDLTNFRSFDRKIFEFQDQFNLLIGDNGTGKTAILDALAVAAGSLFLGFDELNSRHIHVDEVRRVPYTKEGLTSVEPQYPVHVRAEGQIAGSSLRWNRSLQLSGGRTSRVGTKGAADVARKLLQEVRAGRDVDLPLVSYYGTGRLWLQKKAKTVEPVKPGSRLLGYVDCLDPASSLKPVLRWWKTMEFVQLQEGKKIEPFDAIKSALKECLERWEDVWYDVRRDDLYARAADGRELPFHMLSDGVRNMLGMVADIAYRAAVLNPHLGPGVARKTPGIVLIDEIDLHLHPKWQRRVVDDLRRTFPEIQFIATTHSPFIVQSLRPGELINLDMPAAAGAEHRSIEDIAEEDMGVALPQRSKRWREMMQTAEEYYRLLRSAEGASGEEKARAKVKLDTLLAPFSDDPAYVAFLKMERAAAGLGGGEP